MKQNVALALRSRRLFAPNVFRSPIRRTAARGTGLLLTVASLILSSTAAHAELRAAWEFNPADVSGASVTASRSTVANTTGTLTGNAATDAGFLALDGSGDYLAFGTDVTGLRGLTAMTLCAWVRVGDTNTVLRRIVEHDDNYYFFQDKGAFRFVIHGTGGANLTSQTGPAAGTWQHVAATWQLNQSAKLYVNGILEATVDNPTVAMPNAAQRLSFGAQRNNGATPTPTAYFKGDMDDVAVWNEMLTPAQIAALAGTGSGGYKGRVTPLALDAFIATRPATRILRTAATVNGLLVSAGGAPANVRLYWGESDGGADTGAWQNVCDFGSTAPGLLATNLTGLGGGTVYHFRYYAEDGASTAYWSAGGSFTTYGAVPDDLAGLQLWLTPDSGAYADTGGTMPAEQGSTVESWHDRSGNARHAARTGTAGTLKLDTVGLEGFPAIRLTDLNNNAYLTVADYAPQDTDNLTVFLVSRALPQTLNASTIHPLITSGPVVHGGGVFTIATMRPGAGGSGYLGYFGRSFDPYPYDTFTSTNQTPNFSDGRGHVMALTLDAAANAGKGVFAGWYDGAFTQSHAGLTANPTNGPIQIGGSTDNESCRYAGFIGDIILYSRVLNEIERNRIGWYLQSKYGLDGTFTDPLRGWLVSRAATAVSKTSATLNGELLDGDLPVSVTLYWGAADGGDNPAAWAHTNIVGAVSVHGMIGVPVTGLTPGQTLYYRFKSENSHGTVWTDTAGTVTPWRDEPSDIAGLQLWLRADDGVFADSGITSATNGAPVIQWNDASGNARHAARVGSVGNLTYAANALNGLPAVTVTDRDGGDYLNTPAYQVADTDNLTVFAVSRAAPQTLNGSAIHPLVGSGSPGSGKGAFCISTMRPNAGGPGNLGFFGRNYNPFPYDDFTSNSASPNFGDGLGHVIALQLAGADTGGIGTFTGYYDGTFTATHDGSTSDPLNGPVEIGGSSYGTSARYAGAFGDVLIYNRVLGAEERNRVGWYLQTKYGLAGVYRNPFAVAFGTPVLTALAGTSATLAIEVTGGDLPAGVTLHWGETDGGTDAGAWAQSSAPASVGALGTASITAESLLPGTIYHARFSGTNSQGVVWSDSGITFVTPGPPIIATGIPNQVDFNTAVLEGTLVATSGAPASVWIYWGATDGGEEAGSWEHAVALGEKEAGQVWTEIAGLAENTSYFYRLFASNSFGGRWATASVRFTTAFDAPGVRRDGLVLWLRADTGVQHSNGWVHAWADQTTDVGGANDATAAGNARPLFVPEGIGERAAIRFDGSNDFLAVPDNGALDLGTGAGKGWTVLAVYLREKSGTQCIVSKGTAGSDTTDWRLFSEDAGVVWGSGAASDSNAWFRVTEPPANQPHLLAATLTQTGEAEGTKVFYIDGQPYFSETYATKAPANDHPAVIGGFSASNGNLGGLVAEVLVYNRVLNEDDLNNAGWHLQQKYGMDGLFEYRAPRGTMIQVR